MSLPLHRYLLVLGTDSWTGGAHLTRGALELRVVTFTHSAVAGAAPVADLSVGGHAGLCVERTVARAAGVVALALAPSAHALTVTCYTNEGRDGFEIGLEDIKTFRRSLETDS